ncbi:hypothetical protein ACQJBY_067810 [Aegilops geniculata]
MWGESVFHETRLLCLLQSMSLLVCWLGGEGLNMATTAARARIPWSAEECGRRPRRRCSALTSVGQQR